MNPLVSVIIVAYNEQEYIKKALDSILSQKTDFDFEIICHDDASSDKTPEIISEYAEKYPGLIIPILQKENQAQKGRNLYLEYIYPAARGKYAAFCDGDDYWTDKRKLQKQADFLESHEGYAACMHQFYFYYEQSGKKEPAACGMSEKDIGTEDFIKWNVKSVPQLGTAMVNLDMAFRRPGLFHQIGGGKNSLRPISDMPLYIYLSLNGKIRYLPYPMSVWCRRSTGTWEKSAEDIEKNMNYNKQLIHFLQRLNRYTHGEYENCIRKKTNTIQVSMSYQSLDFKRKTAYICYILHIWHSFHSFRMKIFMSFACFVPDAAKQIVKMKQRYNNASVR